MELKAKTHREESINSWHPGSIILNLILVSVAVSFVFGNLLLLGVIIFFGRP